MSMEMKRKKLELARVELARQEQELKIEERLEEIERIKGHIEIQLKKEQELRAELSAIKGE